MEAGAANDEAAASTGEAAPKKARAFRHFAGEYVMIVLSIVTALALENGVRQFNQAREAREATRKLMSNLEMNDITARELYRVLAQMSFVHESNSKNMRTLEKLLVGEQQRSLKQARHKETSA